MSPEDKPNAEEPKKEVKKAEEPVVQKEDEWVEDADGNFVKK